MIDLLAWLTPEEQSQLDHLLTIDDVTVSVPGAFGAWLRGSIGDLSAVSQGLDPTDPEQFAAPHFVVMQQALDKTTAGLLRRVLFQVPIRHGKTTHNSVGYAAYRLERNPRTRILVCSYNQTQAEKLSRDIRTLAKRRGVAMSETRDAAREWETAAGGGVRAVGAGAGVASVNADLIIIDDPIGSREEAESAAHRERVWDWLTNDILARCDPHTAVLFSMSRWHKDDPAGRLLDRQGGRWHVIDLPGLAEKDDPLGRPEGEALWDRRPSSWMEEKRIELGEYGFASLIQGRPRPRLGGMFQWEWWKLVDAVPVAARYIRYWDLAGTKVKSASHDPDFSAGVMGCRLMDLRTAIVDVSRFRKGVAERDAELKRIAIADLERFGAAVSWWIETEAGIAGIDRTSLLVRQLQALGLAVYTEHPTGNKVLRWEPLASAAGAGNVLLCPGAWRDAFRLEGADAPTGTHDDQLDAAAGMFSKLGAEVDEIGFSSVIM